MGLEEERGDGDDWVQKRISCTATAAMKGRDRLS